MLSILLTKQNIVWAVRAVLTSGGSILATMGYFDDNDLQVIVSAGVAIAAELWSLWEKFSQKLEAERLKVNAAAALDKAQTVTTETTTIKAPIKRKPKLRQPS